MTRPLTENQLDQIKITMESFGALYAEGVVVMFADVYTIDAEMLGTIRYSDDDGYTFEATR